MALVACFKNLLGIAGFGYIQAALPEQQNIYRLILTAQVVLFGAVGALVFFRARDRAARYLGMVLMATGNAYAFSIVADASLAAGSPWLEINAFTLNVRTELLLPWALLGFATVFPSNRSGFGARLILRAVTLASLLVVAALQLSAFARIALFVRKGLPDSWMPLAELVRLYQWPVLFPFLTFGVGALLYKLSIATELEKRRVSLFTWGLAFGLGIPAVVITIETLFPRLYQVIIGNEGERLLASFLFVNIVLLTTPFTTSYAVVAQKVLGVKLIARSAVQHLLARYSATLLGLAPFIFLVVFLFHNRQLTLVQLFSGNEATALVGSSALGLVFLRFREPILDSIDRRFFRDRYNARRVLTQLAEQVRGTRNLEELSAMVGNGIDLALHLERASLLALDSTVGRFVDPLDELRPLDSASRLATLVQSNQEPLDIDFDSPSSPLHTLDEQEMHWLIDGQVELLVPAHTLDGTLIGILVLGAKKSELPFLREDRDLLRGVCSAAGLVIELLYLKERTPTPVKRDIPPSPSGRHPALPAIDPEQGATECLACSKIYPAGDGVCPRCQLELEPTLVPYVLRGQYRFESRVGTGGMAVVYRATDLRLGRTVAIKTLPRVSPDAAMRLHREARTAATVTHAGLAGIYGIETWEGVPMLVLEYLPGGTLADQLMRDEPLDSLLAIDMGQSVALALQKIHGAGILHRDIKPSNIGYTEDGHAKLLDFGVARMRHDLRQESETSSQEQSSAGYSRISNTASWVIGRTATGQLVGTLSYLSPEAVRGLRPEPSFDLWALSVVLWESLTGENLFRGRNFRKILDDILAAKVRGIETILPDCPEAMVDFFAQELSRDRARRAQTGVELYERLGRLKQALLAD